MSRAPISLPKLMLVPSVLAGLAAALLASVYLLTEEPIREGLQQRTQAALSEVLPPFNNQPGEETVRIGGVTFFIGRKDGLVTGAAGETITSRGYAGNITVLAGLRPDGAVTTVLVTRHSETPGLGSEVCDRKRAKTLSGLIKGIRKTGLPPNPALDQFSGRRAEPGSPAWAVRKDGGEIDAVTGATITSRAITEAVFTIAETFRSQREQLLSDRTGNTPLN